ncbi:hypothetical protein KP509_05G034000 [Ceratopteris richardii]|uniref:Uncharacterized protein n=1 Tax=Ceratopteris richardii TaxID=49495 RepID=A0A8T2UTK8_CERRI|nr:hypothetical protein KP509_05G034000 [Ceratopteris richardii]
MAIVYAMVARGSVVLAEYNATPSNASTVAKQILEKMPSVAESRVSYSQGRFIFHVIRIEGLTFLCMANDTFGRRIPFTFLEDIHSRFIKTYGPASYMALAYAMNDEFSRVLAQQMDYYSNDPNADIINRMKGDIKQVQNVMLENIDKVLERGDRLELLVDKTANIQSKGFRLRKQARQIRSSMWWRNVKLICSLLVLVLILAYIGVAVYCGGPLLPTCIG